jgi:hypothetical protein
MELFEGFMTAPAGLLPMAHAPKKKAAELCRPAAF